MERFVDKLKRRMSQLRVGDSLDKAVDVGALVDESQRRTVEEYVEQARQEGAEVRFQHTVSELLFRGDGMQLCEGCVLLFRCFRRVRAFQPKVVTIRRHSSQTCRQCQPSSWKRFVSSVFFSLIFEQSLHSHHKYKCGRCSFSQIFGPVLVVLPFRTAKESVALGNNTTYGLAASVWTENVSLALEVAISLKAGTVWVNCHNLFDAAAGFGGYRQSGYGRDGGKEVRGVSVGGFVCVKF